MQTKFAQCLDALTEIKRAIAECEYCLGVLSKDTPAPESSPRKNAPSLAAGARVSEIETITDPDELRALESEFKNRIQDLQNPRADERSIAYKANGELTKFYRDRIARAGEALEKVRNRMQQLGVPAAN